MKPKDYFILGTKLFGIWCFFQGIVGVFAAIPTFMPPPKLSADMGGTYVATVLVTRIVPVLFIAAGIYLLRGWNRLYEFAYPREAEQGPGLEWKFVLFVKLLGIYLLVVYIPDLLRTASAFLILECATIL